MRWRPLPRRHLRQRLLQALELSGRISQGLPRRLLEDPDPQGCPALPGDLADEEGRGLPPHLGEPLGEGQAGGRSYQDLETPTLPIMHLDPSIRLSEFLPFGVEKLLCKIYHNFGLFRTDETAAITRV